MEPQYLQIYKKLRTRIVEGGYRYGDRLPSKRVLAEEHRVSVITAQHAYELLCEEGYVQARQRSGFFVSYRAEDGFALPEEKKSFPSAASFPSSKQVRLRSIFRGRSALSNFPGKYLENSLLRYLSSLDFFVE